MRLALTTPTRVESQVILHKKLAICTVTNLEKCIAQKPSKPDQLSLKFLVPNAMMNVYAECLHLTGFTKQIWTRQLLPEELRWRWVICCEALAKIARSFTVQFIRND